MGTFLEGVRRRPMTSFPKSMIIVPVALEKSPIHGFGVFAKKFIPKGTKVWEFNERFDIRLTPAEFEALPEAVRDEIEIYLYQPEKDGTLYYESTIGRFMNHSRNPNVDYSNVGVGWATRDIQAGEEMTADYRQFMAETDHIKYL